MGKTSIKELKPCPFCGGEAKIRLEYSHDTVTASCICTKCYARTASYPDNSEDGKCVFTAINKWNERYKEEKKNGNEPTAEQVCGI